MSFGKIQKFLALSVGASFLSPLITTQVKAIATLKGVADQEYIAYGKQFPAVGMISSYENSGPFTGTGSFIDVGGKTAVLTAAHVLKNANSATIRFDDEDILLTSWTMCETLEYNPQCVNKKKKWICLSERLMWLLDF